MNESIEFEIRRETLQPAIYFAAPSGAEVQEVVRLAGFTGRAAADYLGLADKNGRQIRRWVTEEASIPYSAWALLCYAAGFGHIWEIQKPNGPGTQMVPDARSPKPNALILSVK